MLQNMPAAQNIYPRMPDAQSVRLRCLPQPPVAIRSQSGLVNKSLSGLGSLETSRDTHAPYNVRLLLADVAIAISI